MPSLIHVEQHFTATELVRDIVIGMSDGLTVPFALAAGLSGATTASGLVVTAGLAEIVAGSIAMGLGGYLAARTDAEHYASERQREVDEVQQVPEREEEEIVEIFRGYGLTTEQAAPIVAALRANPKQWVDFMMRFELGLEAPEPARARRSALTIALSYIGGGFIPLFPYMIFSQVSTALVLSACVTLAALFVFGYVKGYFTGIPPLRGALQTVIVGGLAAAAAFALARLLG